MLISQNLFLFFFLVQLTAVVSTYIGVRNDAVRERFFILFSLLLLLYINVKQLRTKVSNSTEKQFDLLKCIALYLSFNSPVNITILSTDS